MVLKPSEKTPLTALLLADLLYEAGLPPAMFSVVTGDPAEIADELITNPHVELITFTGGVAVGKSIAAKMGYRRAVLEPLQEAVTGLRCGHFPSPSTSLDTSSGLPPGRVWHLARGGQVAEASQGRFPQPSLDAERDAPASGAESSGAITKGQTQQGSVPFSEVNCLSQPSSGDE